VIDYQVHSPVHSYLSESYKQAKFDAVIDCFGSQDLWLHCPAYLKVGKPFLTFGVAPPSSNWGPLLWAIAKTLKNLLWPSILGGIDRPYKVIAGVAQLEKLAALTKEGKLRVPIDSTWKFEDALKVRKKEAKMTQMLMIEIGL
jgi:NADPH:quinone reductase-like Zn-dependent oxidoreductase